MSTVRVELARTPELREKVYRLRYDIFVEEMHLFSGRADHQRRVLVEESDAASRLLLASIDGEPMGTLRLTLGKDAPPSQEYEETYDLGRWVPHTVPVEQIMVCTRFAVRPDLRGGFTAFELIREVLRCGIEEDVELVFADCQPHLLNLYARLGFRSYRPTYPDAEYGIMVPLVLVGRDVEHLRASGSPIADSVLCSPTPTTLRARELIPVAPTVSGTDGLGGTETEGLWRECGAEAADSLVHGLSAEEFSRLLPGGYVIHLQRGDHLISRDQITKTLYVLLSGALEVRDGDETVATMGACEVVGEVAFLLQGQRSLDVWATTDDVRVLSFRERTLRNLLRAQDRTAAQLLENLARLLARRLINSRRRDRSRS